MAEADPSSFASPDSCRTHHLYLRCRVDFESRSLRGTAALTVRAERDNLRCLVTLLLPFPCRAWWALRAPLEESDAKDPVRPVGSVVGLREAAPSEPAKDAPRTAC